MRTILLIAILMLHYTLTYADGATSKIWSDDDLLNAIVKIVDKADLTDEKFYADTLGITFSGGDLLRDSSICAFPGRAPKSTNHFRRFFYHSAPDYINRKSWADGVCTYNYEKKYDGLKLTSVYASIDINTDANCISEDALEGKLSTNNVVAKDAGRMFLYSDHKFTAHFIVRPNTNSCIGRVDFSQNY